jgi:2-polyprenyl-3-methyl-5-hydroxy-6-metoxy-1,4-benzoquinol methylase
MLEELKACPVCEKGNFNSFLTCTDYTVSKEEFNLVSCISCGFVFTNPRPTMETSGFYYKSEDYISHTNSNAGIMNKVYKAVRNKAIQGKLDLIDKYGPLPKSLLDYGCGTGEFLAAAKHSGWVAAGLEIDQDARNLAKENHNLNVDSPDKLATLPNGQFGAITMWHVLEHVHNLKETIGHLRRILSSAGVLIIAVPNHQSNDARHYGRYWAAYDVPRHIYHFSKDSMTKLMTEAGFELKETRSLFFDPFYIALLSEKYKNGWSNPISAALVGMNTTRKGKTKVEENSSLVYVFGKK